MTNVIDFRNPNANSTSEALPEPPGKANMVQWLEDLLEEVKHNKVAGIFCCWIFTDEPESSSGFRVGGQNMTLLGRVTSLSHRMMNDLDKL